MTDILLRVEVLTPPFLVALYVVAGLFTVGLALRRFPGWTRRAAGSAALGAAAGAVTLWLVEGPFNLIGTPLLGSARWSVVVLGMLWGLAAANLWRSAPGRKAFAAAAAALLLGCTGLAVNAQYGLNPTLGDVIGRSAHPGLALPPRTTTGGPHHTGGASTRLADTWTAPTGLPLHGAVGSALIPGTVSGFTARPAGIYLPPATLTTTPPPLPFLLLMMGQPGNPDPRYIATVLDTYAQRHAGLAPIVVVADQLDE